MPETCREQHHTSGNRLRLAAVCQASAKLQVRPKDGGKDPWTPARRFREALEANAAISTCTKEIVPCLS